MIVPVGNSSTATLRDYLTAHEKASLLHMRGRLYELYNKCLLNKEITSDCEASRFVLNLYGKYDNWLGYDDAILITLLEGSLQDNITPFKQLSIILSSGYGPLFFSCAGTSRTNPHSAYKIAEIIALFSKIIAMDHKLVTLPNYDKGGKEALLSLLHPNPVTPFCELYQEPDDYPRVKSLGVQYLSALQESLRLPISTYLEHLKHIESLPIHIPSFVRATIFKLVILFTTNENSPLHNETIRCDIELLINKVADVYQQCGYKFFIFLFSRLEDLRQIKLDTVLCALHQGLKVHHHQRVQKAMVENMSVVNFFSLVKELQVGRDLPFQNDQTSVEILYDRFIGKINDPNVSFALPQNILLTIKQQYLKVATFCSEYKDLDMQELVQLAQDVTKNTSDDAVLKLVAIGRLAIYIQFGIYLHMVQIWTVLAELYFKNGVVAQVKMGEGKTKIVTLLAFVLFLTKKSQGYIIAPADYLAKRDQKEHFNLFRAFGIITSFICDGQYLKSEPFQADIIYGTASDFEFAILAEMLNCNTLYRARSVSTSSKRFDWVIVDELDNLTIDTSLSSARLSFPAETHYNWVYVPIFQFVKKNSHSCVTSELREHLRNYQGGKYALSLDKVSDEQLELWTKSAKEALYERVEKIDYVVSNRHKDQETKGRQVLIVDAKNTGRVLAGCRWSAGIHEFVEVKHSIDVRNESVCPLSISHPVFYHMFDAVYGITGTIGTDIERQELKDVYGLGSFDVPTNKPQQRLDFPAAIYDTDEAYFARIEHLVQVIKDTGRPLLILCETIKDSEILARFLASKNVIFELLNELQDKSEEKIVQQAGAPSAITIATNNAGRGTDIKPSVESLTAGGLHVVISFYPESDRVEFQNRGRAGRQGEPGSSEIIISKEKIVRDNPAFATLGNESILQILQLKRQLRAIKDKDTHVFYADIERVVFKFIIEFYELLNQFYNNRQPPQFFTKLVHILNCRILTAYKPPDFTNYQPKKKEIAEQAAKLLTSAGSSQGQWKTLVARLLSLIRESMLQDFALTFHAVVEQKIRDAERDLQFQLSKISPDNLLKINLTNTSAFTEQIAGLTTKKQQELKQEIQNVYNMQSQRWKKYLNPEGQGALLYLSELLKIDLKPLRGELF